MNMYGSLGQWIDVQDDVVKDRLVRGELGVCVGTSSEITGVGCILQVAASMTSWDLAYCHFDRPAKRYMNSRWGGWLDTPLYNHYDKLRERFGTDRIARAIKLRAAKANTINLGDQQWANGNAATARQPQAAVDTPV